MAAEDSGKEVMLIWDCQYTIILLLIGGIIFSNVILIICLSVIRHCLGFDFIIHSFKFIFENLDFLENSPCLDLVLLH